MVRAALGGLVIPHILAATHAGLENLRAPNTAVLSPCRTWRYLLRRTWDELTPEPRRALFVMLNPSTADETQDDPTIRRCIGFAKRWGFGGVEIVNIFAYRSTDPRALKSLSRATAVGPRNDGFLYDAADRARHTRIVAAWGNHGDLFSRDASVRTLLSDFSVECFRLTGKSQPEHPLYQPYERQLVRWS